jgi:hypothetical protein
MEIVKYDIIMHNQSSNVRFAERKVHNVYVPKRFSFEQMLENYTKNSLMFDIDLESFSTNLNKRSDAACDSTREILDYYGLTSPHERSVRYRIHVQFTEMVHIFMFLVKHGIDDFEYRQESKLSDENNRILVGEGGIVNKIGVGFLI